MIKNPSLLYLSYSALSKKRASLCCQAISNARAVRLIRSVASASGSQHPYQAGECHATPNPASQQPILPRAGVVDISKWSLAGDVHNYQDLPLKLLEADRRTIHVGAELINAGGCCGLRRQRNTGARGRESPPQACQQQLAAAGGRRLGVGAAAGGGSADKQPTGHARQRHATLRCITVQAAACWGGCRAGHCFSRGWEVGAARHHCGAFAATLPAMPFTPFAPLSGSSDTHNALRLTRSILCSV